ncbi:biotin carboxyl carrier protein of acetyl-CoA carboxylase 2, chloroplastic-like [Cucurbita pepo subsp. pepo]|uniref:biotin carboxyl carrier protein of acetyl-CoA carboxylase 2, chloroplastic-like n=1 Tax=Cucurbita pepo subsp. pepo TaxID=3664 RepID=UPI000C9D49C9|nr:biotin carboxyl carrier protein of acetyl-CoA carboxylase 2, chloroplastic-like [Cucurbita pepo subsp. pepo]
MASFTVPCPKPSTLPAFRSASHNNCHRTHIKQNLSLHRRPFCLKDSFSFGSSFVHPPFSGIQEPNKKKSGGVMVHALKEMVVGESSNSAPALVSRGKDESAAEAVSDQNSLPDESTISAFMSQVSDLIKLVDSRDIMELQLKQQDCEIVIRKKEALQPSPYLALPPPPQAYSMVAPPPTLTPTPAPAPTAASAPAKPLPALKAGGSHPPLKCPMAGTFYRSPAPGEPPFVKVGDKVQKGQIICIIEAMKLMNEIEADRSGTIAEILAEDGKPVSVDTPLLVIVP